MAERAGRQFHAGATPSPALYLRTEIRAGNGRARTGRGSAILKIVGLLEVPASQVRECALGLRVEGNRGRRVAILREFQQLFGTSHDMNYTKATPIWVSVLQTERHRRRTPLMTRSKSEGMP
jgi:hypothetical protein